MIYVPLQELQVTRTEAQCSEGHSLFQIKSINVIIHNSLFVYPSYSKAEKNGMG
jgi:hypothetical protein